MAFAADPADLARRVEKLNVLLDIAKAMTVQRDLDSLLDIRREIETAAKLRFTGLVNNANLGEATTADDVAASFPLMAELSAALNLPVVMTTVRRDIALDVPAGQGTRFNITCYGNRFGV